MRVFILATVAALAATAPGLTSQAPIVIRNVSVIDGLSALPRIGNIELRGDTIASVSAAATAPPAGARVIDGTGRFAIPGLWDMHVHLATRPEPNLAEEMILPLLLAHGIVGARDMGGPLERLTDLRARVASGAISGPRILTPGPFVDGPGESGPLFRRPADAQAVTSEVDALRKAGVDFVKAQAGLSPALHRDLAAAARARQIPLAGHIPISMSAEEIIASGQRTIEHVSPALVGDGLLLFACSSQAAELIAEVRAIEAARGSGDAATLARREGALRARAVATYDPARARALGAAMKERDVWIVPTLVWSASLRPASKAEDGSQLPMQFVPGALRIRWTGRRKAYIDGQTDDGFRGAAALAEVALRAVGDMHAAGAKVLAGTDAFDAFVIPGHSLHQELQLLVRAGLTPAQALRTATVEAAAYRGALATEGTIERGKRADLVILDANPLEDMTNISRLHLTIAGGRVQDRQALDALLARVREFAAR
jgi:imidazolonepropionase-like amidohydrolase